MSANPERCSHRRIAARLLLAGSALVLNLAPAGAETLEVVAANPFLVAGKTASTVKGSSVGDVIYGDQAISGPQGPKVVAAAPLVAAVAGTNELFYPVLSADGRKVAFYTFSPLLIPGGGNGFAQVVVRDLVTGEQTLVSATPAGAPGTGNSWEPYIAPDGRRVVFSSDAQDVTGSAIRQIVEVDIESGARRIVSTLGAPGGGDGQAGTSASYTPFYDPTGRKVAFLSNATNLVGAAINAFQVLVKDLQTGELRVVSKSAAGVPADFGATVGTAVHATSPFSLTGDRIVFVSDSDMLVAGDNGSADIFVASTTGAHAIVRASTLPDGSDSAGDFYDPAFAPAGDSILFETNATDLLPNDDASAVDSVYGKTLASGAVALWSRQAGNGASLATPAGNPAWLPDASGVVLSNALLKAATPSGRLDPLFTTPDGDPLDAPVTAYLFSADGRRALVYTAAKNLAVPAQADSDPEWFVLTYAAAAGGNDIIDGREGNDRIFGSAGDDLIVGWTGADILVGGVGEDTASYAGSPAGVTVNLALGKGEGGHAEGDRLAEIEAVIGSGFADGLIGDGGANRLDGGPGADEMTGGKGDDVYAVSSVADVVKETAGGGVDTVESPVSLTLPANVENLRLTGTAAASGTGNGLGNAITGNAAGNILKGLAGADRLEGREGNDRLEGAAGKDRLVGGPGRDVLSGGPGADLFAYEATADSRPGKTRRDQINDFVVAEGDRVDLSAVDANAKVAGNQAFVFIGGKAFTRKAGQLRFARGLLAADVNGDGRADLEIQLKVKGTFRKGQVIR